jgi:uncharacterized membrane protein YfcA
MEENVQERGAGYRYSRRATLPLIRQLSVVPNWRNALLLALQWAVMIAACVIAIRADRWPAYLIAGIVIGWLLLDRLDEHVCRPLIGGIILALAAGQLVRMWRPELLARVPHSRWFAWTMGILTGITTMLANAAGPVVALYLLAVALPKSQLIATGAWFFLIVNLFKVPFSTNLGLIAPGTLAINAALAPGVLLGLLLGRAFLRRLPQRAFETLVLCLAACAAARLIFW